MRLAVRGRQRSVERAGLVVVGEAERFAVERYAQRGERAAVHGVKDLAGQGRAVLGEGDGDLRRGGIAHALAGRDELIEVQRAAQSRRQAQGEAGDARGFVGEGKGELLPAGEVDHGSVRFARIGREGERLALSIAVDPERYTVIAGGDGVGSLHAQKELLRVLGDVLGAIVPACGGGAEADEALVGILGKDGLLALEAVE